MAAEPAVPIQGEVCGFPRPLFCDLAKVALGEFHDAQRPRNSFRENDAVDAFHPFGEEWSDPDCRIRIMVRECKAVIFGIPRMFKVGSTLSSTVVVY